MRLGPDSLRCPQSGEHVEILHRPDEHGEHAEFLITLADVGSGPGHSFRALEPGTQLLGRLTPGHGFEASLEDVFALFDRGELGPDGPIDRAAFEACFERHKDVMVSMRPKRDTPGQA